MDIGGSSDVFKSEREDDCLRLFQPRYSDQLRAAAFFVKPAKEGVDRPSVDVDGDWTHVPAA